MFFSLFSEYLRIQRWKSMFWTSVEVKLDCMNIYWQQRCQIGKSYESNLGLHVIIVNNNWLCDSIT